MKNSNIGIVGLSISHETQNIILNEGTVDEKENTVVRNKINEFVKIINESPLLQLEHNVISNIENKHIEGELAATRFLDNNIKLFEVFTIDEIDDERAKLMKLIGDDNTAFKNKTKKMVLFEAIDMLITETLNDYHKVNVNNIHEATGIILEHLQTPKSEDINESKLFVNDKVLEIAVKLFNKKYSDLHENDMSLIKSLTSNSINKEELLESHKEELLVVLNELNNKNVTENITKAISKINEMKYDNNTVDDLIISLHELKKEIV